VIVFLFISSILLIVYAYFGYPASLLLAGCFRNRDVKQAPISPYVTMIITAYNEEEKIRQKLQNTLSLEYPRDKLQIIVASDGSTDRTNEIVRGCRANGVQLLEIVDRKGKENAQKEAVKQAKGDVIVFTDVATLLGTNGLKQIVSNFADPSVGCVSSEDRLLGKDGEPCGEGLYVRYEMWLRRLESKVSSLVGLSGSLFAARKEVCRDFSEIMQSDFRTVLNSVKLGFRCVTDPLAVAYYRDIADEKREFDRKIRTVIRGLTVFFGHLEYLNIIKYRLFSYQYFCHKLLRWLVPFFLFITLVSNAVLAWKSLLFFILFIGQLSFYSLAILEWKRGSSSSKALVKVPIYFLVVNASIFIAWWKYLKGERVVMWAPSERRESVAEDEALLGDREK
jgi:cellulose synthase/poly-beta-1,6-N-acetylglucosamine synthase-like glycosyltransferase